MGQCRLFSTCASLWNIYSKKPVSSVNLNLIRQSLCKGPDKKKKYVCCPRPDTDSTTTTETSSTDQTTDRKAITVAKEELSSTNSTTEQTADKATIVNEFQITTSTPDPFEKQKHRPGSLIIYSSIN